MATTPVVRSVDLAASPFRAYGLEQLRILRQQMRLGGLLCGRRELRLPNGGSLVAIITGRDERVYITMPSVPKAKPVTVVYATGFICFPRTGADGRVNAQDEIGDSSPVHGVIGWHWKVGSNGVETVYYEQMSVYPLIDEDTTSVVFNTTAAFYGGPEYGNLSMYYQLTDSSGSVGNIILSWRGTPQRYKRIPDVQNIDDFSRLASTSAGHEYYTTFHRHIYRRGFVYTSLPEKMYVMGIGHYLDELLVIAIHDTGQAFDTVVMVSSGAQIKTDDVIEYEEWEYEPSLNSITPTWVELSRKNWGRFELPWFVDNIGTTFICPNGAKIAIDVPTGVVTYSEPGIPSEVPLQVDRVGHKQRFPTVTDVLLMKYYGVDVTLSGDYYWEALEIKRTVSISPLLYDYDRGTGGQKTLSIKTESLCRTNPIDQGAVIRVKEVNTWQIFDNEVLQIGGPDALYVGGEYVTNAYLLGIYDLEVLWTISVGTISQQGVILTLPNCATSADITVTTTGCATGGKIGSESMTSTKEIIKTWHAATSCFSDGLTASTSNGATVVSNDGLMRFTVTAKTTVTGCTHSTTGPTAGVCDVYIFKSDNTCGHTAFPNGTAFGITAGCWANVYGGWYEMYYGNTQDRGAGGLGFSQNYYWPYGGSVYYAYGSTAYKLLGPQTRTCEYYKFTIYCEEYSCVE